MGKKVVTLGEIMLRLSTPGNTRFVQSDSFDVVYGGGEANVAVSCANYGHDAYFVTKLPKHEIGQSAVNALLCVLAKLFMTVLILQLLKLTLLISTLML